MVSIARIVIGISLFVLVNMLFVTVGKADEHRRNDRHGHQYPHHEYRRHYGEAYRGNGYYSEGYDPYLLYSPFVQPYIFHPPATYGGYGYGW